MFICWWCSANWNQPHQILCRTFLATKNLLQVDFQHEKHSTNQKHHHRKNLFLQLMMTMTMTMMVVVLFQLMMFLFQLISHLNTFSLAVLREFCTLLLVQTNLLLFDVLQSSERQLRFFVRCASIRHLSIRLMLSCLLAHHVATMNCFFLHQTELGWVGTNTQQCFKKTIRINTQSKNINIIVIPALLWNISMESVKPSLLRSKRIVRVAPSERLTIVEPRAISKVLSTSKSSVFFSTKSKIINN